MSLKSGKLGVSKDYSDKVDVYLQQSGKMHCTGIDYIFNNGDYQTLKLHWYKPMSWWECIVYYSDSLNKSFTSASLRENWQCVSVPINQFSLHRRNDFNDELDPDIMLTVQALSHWLTFPQYQSKFEGTTEEKKRFYKLINTPAIHIQKHAEIAFDVNDIRKGSDINNGENNSPTKLPTPKKGKKQTIKGISRHVKR